MATKNKKVLFEVDGFEVIDGHSYIVKHKPDANAPSGLKEQGTTKVPTVGAGDTFQCPYQWDEGDLSNGVWDSGMTEHSPIWQNLTPALAKSSAKELYDNIGAPYERSVGKRGIMLDIANQDSFWSDLNFSVEANQMLKTSNKKDLLTLYFGLRKRVLTPPDPNGFKNPKYNSSSFQVVDVTNNVKVKDQRAADKFDAIGDFTILLRTNKTMLMPILKWIGIRPAKTAEDRVLMSLFEDHLTPPNTSTNRINEFNQLVKDSGETVGKTKLLVFDALDEISYKNKISKNGNGALMLEGLEIGLDLKSAALNIATKPEFKELRSKLIIGEDS